MKNKEETQRKKLIEMQIPTSVQIEQQVSVEVDNQLNEKVRESALKKLPSKRNRKRKRKGLAQAISQTTNRTNSLLETVHETILEKAAENTGGLEHGEIIPNVPITSVNNAATQTFNKQLLIQIFKRMNKLLQNQTLPEEEAEVEAEEEGLFTETLVRMIHMICLLP